jgi:hypothetical protein
VASITKISVSAPRLLSKTILLLSRDQAGEESVTQVSSLQSPVLENAILPFFLGMLPGQVYSPYPAPSRPGDRSLLAALVAEVRGHQEVVR